MFGRLPKRARAPPRGVRRQALSRHVRSLVHRHATLMEMIIDRFGHLRADAADRLEIGDAGAAHRLGRAEMLQQGALARGSDAGHLVERRGGDRLLALRPMRADGEAMRLVAKLLDAIEHRIARLQQKWLAAAQMDAFAARVAVRPLGHRRDLDLIRQAKFLEHGIGRGELAGAAVDQHEVGRGPSVQVALVLGELAETPRQHLAHHGVVVAGGQILALHVELAVLPFDEAFGSGDDHRADRVGAGDMAVVVDLDPLGRLVEIEQLGKPRRGSPPARSTRRAGAPAPRAH